jgi:Bifunctional DNA primase/polymerase, N-terminal/AAA domain
MPVPASLPEAALYWASQNFHVFPCVSGGKEPALEAWQEKATTDPAIITAWWQENPAYNIGLSIGASGMCAIDMDGPLGERALAALELEHEFLPATLMQSTPRGGVHYIFMGELPNTAHKLGPKLDTRGGAGGKFGYILGTPSVIAAGRYENNPNGGNYEVIEDRKITRLPDWVANAVLQSQQRYAAASGIEADAPANVERARGHLQILSDTGDIAISGEGGNDRTFRLACELLDLGLTTGTAIALVSEIWNPACQPPWSEEELEIIFENAETYRQNEVGAYAVGNPAETFATSIAAEKATIDQHSGKNPVKQSRFYPRNIPEMESRKPPPWLLEGRLPRNATIIMFGDSQTYKSFLSLDIALALAKGNMPTVYVAGEAGVELQTMRVPAWRMAHEADETIPFYSVDSVPSIRHPEEVIELIEEIKKRGVHPHLVVIDTVAKATRGMNENDAKDMGSFMEGCDTLKKAFGCSVLAIHHSGKDGARGARGSSLLFDDADTVLETLAHRSTKAVEMWVRKQKDAAVPDDPFTFEGKPILRSLVFFPTTYDQHRMLTKGEDTATPKAVSAALKRLGAFGEDKAVTTHVLASGLLPITNGQDSEDHERTLERLAKVLRKCSRGKLEGFAYGHARDLRWALTANHPDKT